MIRLVTGADMRLDKFTACKANFAVARAGLDPPVDGQVANGEGRSRFRPVLMSF